MGENRYDEHTNQVWSLQFLYDQNGSPMGLCLRDSGNTVFSYTYYFTKNLQGDVTAIYRKGYGDDFTLAATYDYDPWGRVTARDANGNVLTYANDPGHIAFVNPIRYRGYYQDNDTGFYYLQSRYYDPELKRFINADSYSSTGQGFLGHNMFAYCNNTPVNTSDPTGELGIIGIGALIGVAGGLSSLVGAVCTGGFKALKQKDTWINTVKSALVGAVVGAASAAVPVVAAKFGKVLGMGAQVLVRMGSSFAGDLLTTRWVNGTLTARDYVMAGLDMVMDGCFSGLSYFYNPWEGFTGNVSNMVIDGAVDVGESALTSGSTTNASQSSQVRPSSGYTPKYKPIRCGHYVSALD